MFQYEYPMANTAVDIAVFRKNPQIEVLLIKRKNEPYKNMWCLPGGYVEIETETLIEAARRELKEETNIEVGALSLDFIMPLDGIGRDPRGRTISNLFLLVYPFNQESCGKVCAGSDAGDAKWFYYLDLPEVGFDHAKAIARSAMQFISDNSED